jgi:hypothetical protein
MTGWSKGRKRATAVSVIGVVAAIAVLLALPLSSLGSTNPISKLTSNLSTALKGATTNASANVQKVGATTTRSSTVARPNSSPSQSSSSTYTPPGYGTNPHGQGTVGSISLGPSQTRPYTYSPAGSASQNEQVVVGRGRSEQQPDGTYDAHTTIAALFGNELLGVDANQGQAAQSPFQPLQSVLDNICTSTSGAICLSVLVADTAASSNGASTHFQTAGVKSNLANLGLNVNAASSDSMIQTSGNCQTSSGASQVAGVALASGNVAGVSKSATSSSACTGQAPTQNDSSSVITLGTAGLPLPAPGCANGTPNTDSGIPALLPIICNADDQTQVAAPFGVREALTVLGLNTGLNQALIRAATAASESHAVAPPASPSSCSDSDKDCGQGETCVNGKDPDGDGDCTGNKCTDGDHDCGIGSNGQPETCVNGNDPDGDGDCTGGTGPSGQKQCTDSDKDCGAGEVCVNGADPDGDGDCQAASTACGDNDHDCGIGPNGQREACVNGSDPDADADCSSQVTALAAKTTLPFTGENVLLVILVGLLLTGGGLTLASRLRTSSHKRR